MHRTRLLFFALLSALAIVVGGRTVLHHRRAANRQAITGGEGHEPPTTVQGLVAAFRSAYDARDLDAVLGLFYYAGVDSTIRASLRRNLAIDLGAGLQVDSIVLRSPGTNDVTRFTLSGVTYAPNLPVVGELDVYFRNNGNGVTSDGFKVGTLEGRYYLVTVAPVAPQPVAPAFTQRYTNARYGITLRYTDDYRVVSGIDGDLFTDTDLAFNHADPVVTLVYTPPRFPGTSYAGAGIALWKIEPPDRTGCRTMGPPETNGDTGIAFYEGVGAANEGNMAKKDSFYLVSRGPDCFKIDARVSVNTASGATALSAQDKVDLLDAMDAVARTLEFTR